MKLCSLEQGKVAYRADFAIYGLLVAVLAGTAWRFVPEGQLLQMVGGVLAGGAAWSLAEYVLHRFVLHGVQPFRRWHALHHARPHALITTPTALTAALFAVLVMLPALWIGPLWRGCAITMGVLAGYLVYGSTHHAVHHWRGQNAWLLERKRIHALHHRAGARTLYGVSSSFWDHVFGSARPT